MSATPSAPALPQGIGRSSARLWALVLLLLVIVALGVSAITLQLREGEIVTNMRTLGAGGAPWGVYISFLVYFIGVAFAGVFLAALTRLLRIEVLEPFSRMGVVLTVTAIALGGSCILADLGDPLNGLMNLPRYARISSPFFGTFTLVVGGFLFPSLVFLYLTGRADAAECAPRARGSLLGLLYRGWASGFQGTAAERARHERASFWLSLAILPLLLMEKSTLGLIFGIQGGRPGWYSALQAPGFVVLAGISGLGVLVVLAALVRWALDLGEALPRAGFRMLGNFTWVLTFIYLYFMILEEVTANYAASAADVGVAHEVVFGAYSPVFWTVVATLVIPLILLFIQFVRGTSSIALVVISGLLVNVAAMLKRYLIVVPSQTHGSLLPYPVGHYVPNGNEVAVILGLMALGALMITFFVKVFPIVPLGRLAPGAEAPSPEPTGRRVVRIAAFSFTLLLGLSLAVVGFAASARVGTSPDADPAIPFAPVLFILGLMVTFYSAVVYEVFPGPGARPPRGDDLAPAALAPAGG